MPLPPRLVPRLAAALLAAGGALHAQEPGPTGAGRPDTLAAELPSVALPPALARVLRDYERAWRAGDAAALAALFTPDGFVLQGGRPPVRGRAAIRAAYAGAGGGALRLRALAHATADSVGYLLGGYRYGEASRDEGKFTLTLRRAADGRWLIASDMDNPNARPPRAAPGATPAVPGPTPGGSGAVGLTVRRDDGAPVAVSAAVLRTLPRATATLPAHGEHATAGAGSARAVHRYAGVPLATLLAHAGAWPAGDAAAGSAGTRGNLRGAALARVVVVTGVDGYRALLALAELDPATVAPAAGGVALLADSVDGRPLPAAEGPYRLVVPGDRRPARSVRQVTGIVVRAAP